jgi:hypothetical protein
MNRSLRLHMSAFALAAAAAVPAHAEPLIYDANGVVVGSPAGIVNEALSAYIPINGSMTVLYFTPKAKSTQLDLCCANVQVLSFRSTDCSGPALIAEATNPVLGTLPSALLVGQVHLWLHLADSMESVGTVALGSVLTVDGHCLPVSYSKRVWKTSKPAIDLNTLYTPPFSIH